MKKVIIGGTFETLHKGHRVFLEKAFSLGDEVFIGLTSDKLAKEAKKREVLEFEVRRNNLEEYLHDSLYNRFKIEKIYDKFGPAADEDFNFIVVSPETHKTALEINERRQKVGKDEIEIVEIPFVLAEDGKPISSTRIVKKEIDKEGKLLK